MPTKKSGEGQVSGRASPARMPRDSPAVPCSFPCPRGTATGPTGSRPGTRRHVGGMKQGGLGREWDSAGIHELLAEKHIALTA